MPPNEQFLASRPRPSHSCSLCAAGPPVSCPSSPIPPPCARARASSSLFPSRQRRQRVAPSSAESRQPSPPHSSAQRHPRRCVPFHSARSEPRCSSSCSPHSRIAVSSETDVTSSTRVAPRITHDGHHDAQAADWRRHTHTKQSRWPRALRGGGHTMASTDCV